MIFEASIIIEQSQLRIYKYKLTIFVQSARDSAHCDDMVWFPLYALNCELLLVKWWSNVDSIKLVFHQAIFFARSDMELWKLNRFLISSSRELVRQNKKSLRAKTSASGKPALTEVEPAWGITIIEMPSIMNVLSETRSNTSQDASKTLQTCV